MLRRAIPLAIAALSCVGFIAVATPAHASTSGALSRCNSGGFSDAAASVTVPGTGAAFVGGGPNQDPSTPLRNQIRPGDVIRVFASGQVSYGGIFNWAGTWGPNGNGQLAPLDSSWPFPGGPQYALVGTFNQNGADVRLGSMSACLVVPFAGDGVSIPWGLWLQPNDCWSLDNSGAYFATVRVWMSSRSP